MRLTEDTETDVIHKVLSSVKISNDPKIFDTLNIPWLIREFPFNGINIFGSSYSQINKYDLTRRTDVTT